MEYFTPKQVAEKWGISLRTVHAYCADKKIPGVIRSGKHYLIPKTAQKPVDGRIKKAKKQKDVEPYHFPLFIFSRYYIDRDELNDDELLLLDAQVLYIKGEWEESIKLCRKVIAQTISESVMFGAYWTNALSFQHIGLPYEARNYMNMMASHCEQHSEHEEDYRMMMAYAHLMHTLNITEFFTIDPLKVSEDALIFYGCFSLFVAALHSSSESFFAMGIFLALNQRIKFREIHPALFVIHSCLGHLYSLNGDEERQMEHIQEACKIGYEYGYNSLISQCSTFAVEAFDQGLSLYGDDYAKKIEKQRNKVLKNNILVTNFIRGQKTVLEGTTDSEIEIIFLLSAQKTNRAIAELKNISEKEVREQIRHICKRRGLRTKKELIYDCKELLGTFFQEAKLTVDAHLDQSTDYVE